MTAANPEDVFSRRVYCVLGVPVDQISMPELVARIHRSASRREPLFLSTPNLNYLMLAQREEAFRRSLLASDLCPADGMGVLLICTLLGIPITSRVAGSDLPAALRNIQTSDARGLRLALLGGQPGVGELARAAINAADTKRLECVAAIDPGVMTEERIGDEAILAQLNATKADFLLVALGAQTGQAWIMRNRAKLVVPVVSHLGATLNFLAGAVKRAPPGFQKLGLEWLWRIKEEPKLAIRYLLDGSRLVSLLAKRILPLSVWLRRGHADVMREGSGVWLNTDAPEHCKITIAGNLRDDQLTPVIEAFRNAAALGRNTTLDIGRLEWFGMGFAGQLLMLERAAQRRGNTLRLEGASAAVSRALGWCGLGHLRALG